MSNPGLYGQKPQKQSTSDAPSSSNLAFTTTLSSLIASGTSDKDSSRHGRTRPSKYSKSDIFARPNKGAQKRAAADLRDDDDTAVRQVHQSSKDIGSVDTATLHRSKRRMEEKARQYDDLKKGLYLAAGSESDDDDDHGPSADAYLSRLRRKEKEGLVDFDKKWADAEREKGSDDDTDSSFEHTDDDGDNASVVSYEDELGRTRRGTRKEAAQAARLKNEAGEKEQEKERWRPSRPENLIYGATVQSEAFQQTDIAAEQMAYLSKRRDRSPTPDEVHYDADAEVRNRGTGFYAFSKDEEVRKTQMEELLNARVETERERDARQERRVERERVKDERRKEIDKLRAKRRAETFLSGLGEIGVSG
ncbi:CCDC174 family protein [Aspergillus puulaauensis]|uniref:Coiled-coil domain-containing protein n=1 Tax=Aspergillus puulaauensis TaxID=1220207 RepID=A0A7R7XJX0_9EURO|nr:uncharacterized protein APUU_30678A [Aspergillus puulaauensis]BCS22453.1 hypothetical protein APUU_30678A [Aspergillus puulaauensis]